MTTNTTITAEAAAKAEALRTYNREYQRQRRAAAKLAVPTEDDPKPTKRKKGQRKNTALTNAALRKMVESLQAEVLQMKRELRQAQAPRRSAPASPPIPVEPIKYEKIEARPASFGNRFATPKVEVVEPVQAQAIQAQTVEIAPEHDALSIAERLRARKLAQFYSSLTTDTSSKSAAKARLEGLAARAGMTFDAFMASL